jgi:hypothetical protein
MRPLLALSRCGLVWLAIKKNAIPDQVWRPFFKIRIAKILRSALFRRCNRGQLWGRGGWHGLFGRSNHLRAWHDGFRDNWATAIAGGFSHNHVRNWCALVLVLAEQAVEQASFRACLAPDSARAATADRLAVAGAVTRRIAGAIACGIAG